uniref:CAP N-terminal domain-containing protein n=1 Tax=Arcella intermedia TaxID=1963864 RepID=A0A6B2L7G3_9EUKA
MQAFLAPVSELMGKIGEVEGKYRGKDHVNHLKTVSEGVQALGWVCVEPTPAPFVKETIGSSEFWSNKILKDYKGKDEGHINWVKGFNGFLKALVPYIQANHTTGLAWNTLGGRTVAAAAPVVQSAGGAQKAFEDLIEEFINPFVQHSDKIGGDVAAQAKLFKEAVVKSAQLIGTASKTKKPSEDAMQAFLAPVSELMGKIGEVEGKYRGKDHVNHLKTVSEGVQALGWVCVEPTPAPFVKETIGSSEFWSNKILSAYKGKDETHVSWVQAFNGFLKALPPYIVSYHTTGLTWSK